MNMFSFKMEKKIFFFHFGCCLLPEKFSDCLKNIDLPAALWAPRRLLRRRLYAKAEEQPEQEYCQKIIVIATWGRCMVGQMGHGPAKILVGWATMHLAPPIIGLYGH